MTRGPLSVLLVGEEAAGARALNAVLDAGHRVVLALTGRDAAAETVVKGMAERAGVPTAPATWVRDAGFAKEARKLDVDVLLNVHSLYLVADAVLEAPRIGSFNLHPGPLPEYAGLNCISWAIYNGERDYGVTLHWMVPRVDAGDVAFRAPVAVEERDTALSLGTRCTRTGVALLPRLLEAARSPAGIPRQPQDLSRRRYYAASDVPQEGRIDWARPAEEIVRFVRACNYGPFGSPWGRPRARLEARDVSVLSADRTGRVADAAPGTLVLDDEERVCVMAADEWIELKQVADAEGRVLPPREAFRLGASEVEEGGRKADAE